MVLFYIFNYHGSDFYYVVDVIPTLVKSFCSLFSLKQKKILIFLRSKFWRSFLLPFPSLEVSVGFNILHSLNLIPFNFLPSPRTRILKILVE